METLLLHKVKDRSLFGALECQVISNADLCVCLPKYSLQRSRAENPLQVSFFSRDLVTDKGKGEKRTIKSGGGLSM